MFSRAAIFALTIVLAPPAAHAADLVVWWEKGFYAQEDDAVREIIAAFEQETGKQVELVQPTQAEGHGRVEAALAAGQPPDFLFLSIGSGSLAQWAYEDRLADLKHVIGPRLDLFDADAVEAATLLNGSTGARGFYALPMGRYSNHIHAWRSLLDRAGFTLDDIPREWDAFWWFWCDQVQPAVRQAMGRDDIWGVGLPMSAEATIDTQDELVQFQLAYGAPWVSDQGKLQVDDPEIRQGLIKALDAYTDIWRKDCTPPDSVSWTNVDNNKAFLEQKVVLTANTTLSVPSALQNKNPDDYRMNAATIDWPTGANGRSLTLVGSLVHAVVFNATSNRGTADHFVHFLIDGGCLAHWLNFAGDRYLPPMRKLVEQPFWLDPADPHRMRAALQMLTRPHQGSSIVRDKERQSNQLRRENVWGRAVHRVVTDDISPEQAVDEAILRIKQILAE